MPFRVLSVAHVFGDTSRYSCMYIDVRVNKYEDAFILYEWAYRYMRYMCVHKCVHALMHIELCIDVQYSNGTRYRAMCLCI